MNGTLTIRNFGPIRDAEITVRDLTVFVGPQATGKSLIAQLLYFLRGFENLEELAFLVEVEHVDPVRFIQSGLTWWLGNSLDVYVQGDTLLRWQPEGKRAQTIRWRQNIPEPNMELTKRIVEWISKNPWVDSHRHVYIPAGRNLFSFHPPYSSTSRRFLQQWPGYTSTFYDVLGNALRTLWQRQEKGLLPLDASDSHFLKQRFREIIKGRVQYGPDTLLLEVEGKIFPPTTIAAGQMEIWPFQAIVEMSLEGFGSTTTFANSMWQTFSFIYFEEPEAHLHPAAQHNVMEIIACLIRQHRKQFILTTHSPYILYAVNNFLMTDQVLDSKHDLPDSASLETALRDEQVAAYRFTSEGYVEDIFDREIGLIDEAELNKVANQQIETFTDLQESLEGVA
jgi:hypothetical protein